MHIYLVPISVNRWKPKYCAKIKAKKNTYQLNFRRICTQLYTSQTISYRTSRIFKMGKSITVTLNRSRQLPIRNQINVKILWLPNIWLRNVCCIIVTVLHSCKTYKIVQILLPPNICSRTLPSTYMMFACNFTFPLSSGMPSKLLVLMVVTERIGEKLNFNYNNNNNL
jgi:hypothetical protein